MAPIGIAIIGGGIFVKTEHLPAVEKCDDLALKAIFSRSLKSAQDTAALITKAGPAPELYAADAGAGRTYHDLLLRDDVAAVIIALPITSQPEYIEAALAAGKHVLAEKPVAKDVAAGHALIDYYRRTAAAQAQPATLAIAENFRYTPFFIYARDEARRLGGRVTHFTSRVNFFMSQDDKYYKTSWRAQPAHQGGFLLDAGVHFAAAARLFLAGDKDAAVSVRAYGDLVYDHLAPVDTLNALIRTRSGATGTYTHSAASHARAFEWTVELEGGSVHAEFDTVTVTPRGGEPVSKKFERTSGVAEEVAAWAKALQAGKPDPLQSPEEALADLELVEKMLRSGEQDGATQALELQ